MDPAKMADLEKDTKDKHDDGRWEGWVWTAEVDGATGMPERKV